jgi:hypothetical protein
MKNITLLIVSLLALFFPGGPTMKRDLRTLSGVIYFTNNTPRDMDTYPIELFTRDQRKLIASTKLNAQHNFSITDVAPGEYVLKITRPKVCTLRYRVDVRTESKTRIRVIMDAACAHNDGSVLELDEN